MPNGHRAISWSVETALFQIHEVIKPFSNILIVRICIHSPPLPRSDLRPPRCHLALIRLPGCETWSEIFGPSSRFKPSCQAVGFVWLCRVKIEVPEQHVYGLLPLLMCREVIREDIGLSESEKNRLFFLEVCEFGRSKADWIKVLKYFSKTSDRS